MYENKWEINGGEIESHVIDNDRNKFKARYKATHYSTSSIKLIGLQSASKRDQIKTILDTWARLDIDLFSK